MACSPTWPQSDVGLDHEAGAALLQAFGQDVPVVPGEDHAEVRHRHVVAVHRVAAGVALGVGLRVLVDDQLVTEEAEVDPVLGGAAFAQAEDLAERRAAGRSWTGMAMEGHQAHGAVPLWVCRDYLPCRFRWKARNISTEQHLFRGLMIRELRTLTAVARRGSLPRRGTGGLTRVGGERADPRAGTRVGVELFQRMPRGYLNEAGRQAVRTAEADPRCSTASARRQREAAHENVGKHEDRIGKSRR